MFKTQLLTTSIRSVGGVDGTGGKDELVGKPEKLHASDYQSEAEE